MLLKYAQDKYSINFFVVRDLDLWHNIEMQKPVYWSLWDF